MTPNRLFRHSGLALIGAGLLLALGMILHPDLSNPRAAMQPLWAPSHVAILAGLLLALFGTIGLFLRQADRAGWLGLAGLVLIDTGIVLTVVAIVVDAFVFPAIATSPGGAALLDSAGPLLNGPLGLLLLGATVTYVLGTLLLGAAALRAGVFPRGAVALLVVGGTLVALDPFVPQLIAKLGAVVLGLSFVWLGASLVGRGRGDVIPSWGAGPEGGAASS